MITENQIKDFVKWAQLFGVDFRPFEVKRAINSGNPTKVWRTLFCAYNEIEFMKSQVKGL